MLTPEQTPIEQLQPYKNNARLHSDAQVEQIAKSIEEFGFLNPVLVDDQYTILAGHGRVMGAKKLGIDTVPTIQIKHLSESQKKAYIIADNQIALNAGWDNQILWDEIEKLTKMDFDMKVTGFNTEDINELLTNIAIPDIEEIGEIDEKCNLIIKCDNIKQKELLKNKLQTKTDKPNAKDIIQCLQD